MWRSKIPNGQFHSKIFRRLFFTYVIMILLFLSGYCGIVIKDYNAHAKTQIDQNFSLKSEEVGNLLDRKLFEAQYMVSNINGSATIKALYGTLVISKSSVESYLASQVSKEMTSIKTQGNNLSVYNIILLFNDCNKAYTASSVISLQNPYVNMHNISNVLRVGTASELLEIESRNIVFNKEFLLYCDDYNYTYSGASKGTILVLMNKDEILKQVTCAIGDDIGFEMTSNGEQILTQGKLDGIVYTYQSTMNDNISYQIYVPESNFTPEWNGIVFVTIGVGVLLSIIFIIISWIVSSKHYSPYANIVKIMQHKDSRILQDGDTDYLVQEIGALVTERNATKDRIVEISPYVKQGVLYGVLNGNMQAEQLKILYGENYIGTEMVYFAVAVINLMYKGKQDSSNSYSRAMGKVEQKAEQLSTERCKLDCCIKNSNNIFCILNLDDAQDWEEIFYQLHKEIRMELEDDSYQITFGVGRLEDDLSRLKAACQEAENALNQMIIGGRNEVYFYEVKLVPESDDYYFPKDSAKRLAKDFKEKNLADLKEYLNEIYEKNIKEFDVSAKAMGLLVDELHLVTVNVLKSFNLYCTTSIQITKIEEAATIEEIFSYYEMVFETIVKELPELVDTKEELEKVEREILEYIDENYTDTELSLTYLVEKFQVTNKFISIICNNHYGVNYLQYVQKKRIMYAVELMKENQYTIEEVARMSGYTNVLTFRRNFKSIIGMNPSDYIVPRQES